MSLLFLRLRTLGEKIPQNLKIIGSYFTLYFLTLFLTRLAFEIDNSSKIAGEGFYKILVSFALGARFDLAVIAILLGWIWFLSCIHYLNRMKYYRLAWGTLPILIYFWMIGYLVADFVYYRESSKHLGYEGSLFLTGDFFVVLKSAIRHDSFLILSSLLVVLFLLPFSMRRFAKWDPYKGSKSAKHLEYSQIPLALIIVFVLIRGGLQSRPLRVSDAVFSDNRALNCLSMNGIYTMVADMFNQSVNQDLRMSKLRSLNIVKDKISYPGSKFINDSFPLMRETIPKTNKGKSPNIVIILLESWTGKFLKPSGSGIVDGKEVTPEMNQLIRQGMFFEHFIATGGRTANGLLSTLTGIPDLPGLTVLRRQEIVNKFSSVASVLKQGGYESYFLYGGDITFDNMNVLFKNWGFDHILDEEHIKSTGKYETGDWGYFDGDTLQHLHEQMMGARSPFLMVSLTLTTHYPYRTPNKSFDIFSSNVTDYDYLNSLHYADWAIGKFMEKAKSSPYFEDTVFFFVADHSHHKHLEPFEDRNIPFLIYSPKYVKPSKEDRIASQLDVIPTVLGFVNKSVKFSSMGRNLLDLDKNDPGFAYFAYGNLIGWVDKDVLLYHFVDSEKKHTYSMVGDKPNSYCEEHGMECKTDDNNAKAFLNLSENLLEKNQIFPEMIGSEANNSRY
ncbi:LTA synthase family protein [Leptospira langatensis]|uniref:LTA synthase family protein n=1 Tax=Leptospira langatensis TaxID=2484983 RepID=A0A5F1ZTF3_9LEPT|nr:LTA synthase family protein [Leptospira langatensis]TGJ98945.1 LTA synthase family protein [Leptospira langatensis]TGL40486.1 LTA synthase family protein [Leptospira langatensis]